MDSQIIDDLLGEFRECLDRGGHFKHVVNTELGLAEGFEYLGQPEKARPHYEAVRKYVVALRKLPEFREKELAVPIPRECMINIPNREYIERAYSHAGEKSPE